LASRRSAVTLALTTTVNYGQPHTEASEATRALATGVQQQAQLLQLLYSGGTQLDRRDRMSATG